MFFYSPGWLFIMIVSVVLGAITQSYIKSTYRQWSRVPLNSGMTGAEVARRVLEHNGLAGSGSVVTKAGGSNGVRILSVGGNLTDNYDPRNKTLNLSEGVYAGSSVAAAGVAAHEAGHAIQDATGYVWGRFRSILVPAASFGSGAAWILIIIGFLLGVASSFGYYAVLLGVAFYGTAVLFQFVTLPVELDASRRAMASLEATGTLSGEQLGGARRVLTAAAFTYVAAALVALLQLLYLFGFLRRD